MVGLNTPAGKLCVYDGSIYIERVYITWVFLKPFDTSLTENIFKEL